MQDTLHSAICKDGRFLLEQEGDSSGNGSGGKGEGEQPEAKWALNGSIVESLLTARAKYLLCTMMALIVRPNYEQDNVSKKLRFVDFEDLDVTSVQWLYDLLVYMCREDFKNSHAFISELESRFLLVHASEECNKTWSAMWAEVLLKAVQARGKAAKGKGKDDKFQEAAYDKLLPAVKSVIASTVAESASGKQVKKEPADADAADEEGNAKQGATAAEQQPVIPYFSKIYTASVDGSSSDVNTMDVLAVQAQIQQRLLMKAGRFGFHFLPFLKHEFM